MMTTPVDIEKLKELLASQGWVPWPHRIVPSSAPAQELCIAAVNSLPALIAKAERVDALEAALRFYADTANPRAWCQHVTADPSHPFGHRPVGKPVPSDALLEDRGQLARNALSPKESE